MLLSARGYDFSLIYYKEFSSLQTPRLDYIIEKTDVQTSVNPIHFSNFYKTADPLAQHDSEQNVDGCNSFVY